MPELSFSPTGKHLAVYGGVWYFRLLRLTEAELVHLKPFDADDRRTPPWTPSAPSRVTECLSWPFMDDPLEEEKYADWLARETKTMEKEASLRYENIRSQTKNPAMINPNVSKDHLYILGLDLKDKKIYFSRCSRGGTYSQLYFMKLEDEFIHKVESIYKGIDKDHPASYFQVDSKIREIEKRLIKPEREYDPEVLFRQTATETKTVVKDGFELRVFVMDYHMAFKGFSKTGQFEAFKMELKELYSVPISNIAIAVVTLAYDPHLPKLKEERILVLKAGQ